MGGKPVQSSQVPLRPRGMVDHTHRCCFCQECCLDGMGVQRAPPSLGSGEGNEEPLQQLSPPTQEVPEDSSIEYFCGQ